MLGVLSDLQKSSQATADMLGTLKNTTESMNIAAQKQLGLFYDVAVNVVFDTQGKEMTFINEGRTNVLVWGGVIGDVTPNMEKDGRIILPGAGYMVDGSRIYDFLVARFPSPGDGQVPSEFYYKNARGEEFVQYGYVGVHWNGLLPNITTQTTYIVPEKWSAKKKGSIPGKLH